MDNSIAQHRIAHGIVSCSELHIYASLYRAMGPCGFGASGNSCMLSRDLGAFPCRAVSRFLLSVQIMLPVQYVCGYG
jgi:hypothetical protein